MYLTHVLLQSALHASLKKSPKGMLSLATNLHCKAILGWGQALLMGWILLWIMPMVQGRSLTLLICSPTRQHWATDARTCEMSQRPGYRLILPPGRADGQTNYKASIIDVQSGIPCDKLLLGKISSYTSLSEGDVDRETWEINQENDTIDITEIR